KHQRTAGKAVPFGKLRFTVNFRDCNYSNEVTEQTKPMRIVKGDVEYFPGIGKIEFEGRDSDNPLAFKYYDANRIVDGKSMRDHFRFAVAYWHSFCNELSDPFGSGTRPMPWLDHSDAMQRAFQKMDVA